MLLTKQPGDTGIYATATTNEVRLYYVLDRVLPRVSMNAADGTGIDTSFRWNTNTALSASSDLLYQAEAAEVACSIAAAPACVPREHLRLLHRLTTSGGRGLHSTGGGAADATNGLGNLRWGSALLPFHVVPCSAASLSFSSTAATEWFASAAAAAAAGHSEEAGAGGVPPLPYSSTNAAAATGAFQPGARPTLSSRGQGSAYGGGGVLNGAVLQHPSTPTTLSMSCAIDCVLVFLATADGQTWMCRSDATTISPLRLSATAGLARRRYGPGGAAGAAAAVAAFSSPRPPRPSSAPANASFPAASLVSSERGATPPLGTTAADDLGPRDTLLSDSEVEAEDADRLLPPFLSLHRGGGGGSISNGRRRGGGSWNGSFSVPMDPTTSSLANINVTTSAAATSAAVASHRSDHVVTASGWDPRNDAILALGRQSGVVQLLDVEYVVGSVASTCCSSTTATDLSGDHTVLPFLASGNGAASSSRLHGGSHYAPYTGANHLSYSVLQHKEMVGAVTALDWMPQSHLTVLAARRRDGLGCYAELFDLRASQDGVTYLGAPPEVFGVPIYTSNTEGGAAPSVLCSAEHVACHASQRYVATVGTMRMRDMVQLWDVRMTTRPLAYQVYVRAGYTSLCWSATESGVVLGTTRDGGLRAHHFPEMGIARTGQSLSGAVVGSALQGGGGRRGRWRRRGTSGGPTPRAGDTDAAERWGSGSSNAAQSHHHHHNAQTHGGQHANSGTEAEEEGLEDSGSFRSGVSVDGVGGGGTALSSATEGSNALVKVSFKTQSSMRCRLPSRVPAAAVAWVCHPTAAAASSGCAGGVGGGETAVRGGGGREHRGRDVEGTGRGKSSPATGLRYGSHMHAHPSAEHGVGRLAMDSLTTAENTVTEEPQVAETVMRRGFRTDLPQLLLLNAKDGELYTQVYNPRGSQITIINQSLTLVATGPNAFLASGSAAYKTAMRAYEEAVLTTLESQAAAARMVPGLEEWGDRSCTPATAARVGATQGMIVTVRKGQAMSAHSSPAPGPMHGGGSSSSDHNTAGGHVAAQGETVLRGETRAGKGADTTTITATGAGGAVAAADGRSTHVAKRVSDRPVDLVGLGLLDEEDEEEEEEGSRSRSGSRSGNSSRDGSQDGHTTGGAANHCTQYSPNGSHVGTAGSAGEKEGHALPSLSFSHPRGAATGTAMTTSAAGAADERSALGIPAAPGASRGGRPVAESSPVSSVSSSSPAMTPAERKAREGTRVNPHSSSPLFTSEVAPSVAASIPSELSFCAFHPVDRTKLMWRRLRSGFGGNPFRNLRLLLQEGVDREAYTSFMYGCCASLLLYPRCEAMTKEADAAAVSPAAVALRFPLLLGGKKIVPGLMELLSCERRLRARYGLREKRLSSAFRLSPAHTEETGSASSAGGSLSAAVVESRTTSSLTPATTPVPNRGMPSARTSFSLGTTPLLSGLPNAMTGAVDRDTRGLPGGFLRSPFEMAAANMRAGRLPAPGSITPVTTAAGHRAGLSTEGSRNADPGSRTQTPNTSNRPSPAPAAAAAAAAERPAFPACLGSLRVLILQSMGWSKPPASCHVEETSKVQAEKTAQGRRQRDGTTSSSSPSADEVARHPAERLFIQGDGVGQSTLQMAVERRVAVLTLLDRLEDAAELLSLYADRNPQYPSIALTLSAARCSPTSLVSLAAADCARVTFWLRLVLTYLELFVRKGQSQQEQLTGTAVTQPTAQEKKIGSRFDSLFTVSEQKAITLHLLHRYPRLSISDKVGLAAALLLPPAYHDAHMENLFEVLRRLVQQQYRAAIPTLQMAGQGVESCVGETGSGSRAPLSSVGRGGGSSSSPLPAFPRTPSPQPSPLPPSQTVPRNAAEPPTPAAITKQAAKQEERARRGCESITGHRFRPLTGSCLLLVTAVEGTSTDCRALCRYADESGDMQTPLFYAAVFGNVHGSAFRMWREGYRAQLNDQGLGMWRSQVDLQCVKLMRAREEAERELQASTDNSVSAVWGTDGIIGGAGVSCMVDGVEGRTSSGAATAAAAAALIPNGLTVPKGFSGALGATLNSAAVMVSTQSTLMAKRALKSITAPTGVAVMERGRLSQDSASASATAAAALERQRDVELRCNCGQAMHATALGKSVLSTMANTSATRRQLIPCGNPECRQWQTPMCTVCGERMEHRATELPAERFFAWCSVCLHGGHWCHLREWFGKHTKCPVENCSCHCCDDAHLT